MQLGFGSQTESSGFIPDADRGGILEVIHTSQGDLENTREPAKTQKKHSQSAAEEEEDEECWRTPTEQSQHLCFGPLKAKATVQGGPTAGGLMGNTWVCVCVGGAG